MRGPLPRLIVITDWKLGEELLLKRLEQALRAGPGIAVQHRHPEATTRTFFDEGVKLKGLCDRFGAELFINRRLDVALALRASLHLPAYALSPAQLGPHPSPLPYGGEGAFFLSVAVHSLEEATRAHGADLALVSPVFGKGDATPLGLAGFAQLAAALPCPAFALGGVTSPVPGAAGHAVISAVLHSDDPRAAAAKLLGR